MVVSHRGAAYWAALLLLASAAATPAAAATYKVDCASPESAEGMCRRMDPAYVKTTLGVTDYPAQAGDQYTGYVQGPASDSMFFFWFVERETSPSDAPIVVWFNGGPGCSSLGFGGGFNGHGPFVLDEGTGGFRYNAEGSWSKQANVLYIDYPVGAGLSFDAAGASHQYSDSKAQYKELAGALSALLSDTAPFSSGYTGPVVLAGESYGGVYVTFLAAALAAHPALAGRVKTIALLNPQIRVSTDLCGQAEYVARSGFDADYIAAVEAQCAAASPALVAALKGSDVEGFMAACTALRPSAGKCHLAVRTATDHALRHEPRINPYNVDKPCPNPENNPACYDFGPLETAAAKILASFRPGNLPSGLNPHVTHKWRACADMAAYKTTQNLTGEVKAAAAGHRVVVVSGERDLVKSFVGTEAALEEVMGEAGSSLYTWAHGSLRRWAGGVSMVTLSGAGHLTSLDAPAALLAVLDSEVVGGGDPPGLKPAPSGATHLFDVVKSTGGEAAPAEVV